MKLLRIYNCLCDETRLRIVYLLTHDPLCVSEIQEVLRLPQVRISKHLAYLRENGLAEPERNGNRVIYRLPEKRPFELERHLQCLQDCVQESGVFRADLKRLLRMRQHSLRKF